MLSNQPNEFVLLDVDLGSREDLGARLRATAIECAGGDPALVPGRQNMETSEQWNTVNGAIAWLLPQVNEALKAHGRQPVHQDQIRQALFATSSTKGHTLEAVCEVLGVDPREFLRAA